MKILAVEFSSPQRSVALWETSPPVLLASAHDTPPPRSSESPFPRQRSLGLVEEALAQAKCQREEIAVIAVGLGPGSYTGIRGGIALAQGWQLGRNIQILGVPSTECLAAQAHAEGRRGPFNIIIDAQRNEFYLARYDLGVETYQELEPLRLATRAEIQSLADAGQPLLGPGLAPWFPSATEMYPAATALGRLACSRRDYTPGEKVEPIYLRETAFKKVANSTLPT